jgi:DNA-binding transcriptional ArsR family regulator
MRDAARFFKVLADEARLQMLWLLFNHRELCVCDIMGALGITQSKASRHLLTMRHAGLVVDRKEGLWSYYQLCEVDDPLVKTHLELLRETLSKRADAPALLRSMRASLAERSCATAGASLTLAPPSKRKNTRGASAKEARRARSTP